MGLQIFREIGTHTDRAETRRRYYRFRMPIDVLLALAAGTLLTLGPALIDLMYDPRYSNAGTILQFLALGFPLTGIGIIHASFRRSEALSLHRRAASVVAACHVLDLADRGARGL